MSAAIDWRELARLSKLWADTGPFPVAEQERYRAAYDRRVALQGPAAPEPVDAIPAEELEAQIGLRCQRGGGCPSPLSCCEQDRCLWTVEGLR